MPTDTLNSTIAATLNACQTVFEKAKSDFSDCRIAEPHQNNGTAACQCWSQVSKGESDILVDG